MSNLMFGVKRVDWCVDSAKRSDSVEADSILRGIRTDDSKHIVLLESSLSEAGGSPRDRPGQLGISDDASGGPLDKRWLVAEFAGAGEHKLRQGHFRNAYVGEWSSEDHKKCSANC